MESYFSTMFEVVSHKRWLMLIISLSVSDKSKQSGFMDHEIDIITNLASQ